MLEGITKAYRGPYCKLESGKGTREQGILREFLCMVNSCVAIVTEMGGSLIPRIKFCNMEGT